MKGKVMRRAMEWRVVKEDLGFGVHCSKFYLRT